MINDTPLKDHCVLSQEPTNLVTIVYPPPHIREKPFLQRFVNVALMDPDKNIREVPMNFLYRGDFSLGIRLRLSLIKILVKSTNSVIKALDKKMPIPMVTDSNCKVYTIEE